jgi:hypothetical protein
MDDCAVAVALGWVCPVDLDPRLLAFLVALHDIGKFSRPFQAKAPEYWPTALGFYRPAPAGPAHDAVGCICCVARWPTCSMNFCPAEREAGRTPQGLISGGR